MCQSEGIICAGAEMVRICPSVMIRRVVWIGVICRIYVKTSFKKKYKSKIKIRH